MKKINRLIKKISGEEDIKISKGYKPKDAKPNHDPDKVWIPKEAMDYFKSSSQQNPTVNYFQIEKIGLTVNHVWLYCTQTHEIEF